MELTDIYYPKTVNAELGRAVLNLSGDEKVNVLFSCLGFLCGKCCQVTAEFPKVSAVLETRAITLVIFFSEISVI